MHDRLSDELKVGHAAGRVILAHTSDVHLDASSYEDNDRALASLDVLRRVIRAAADAQSDVLVIAGDLFEHNRLPLDFIEQVATVLVQAGRPVVILPGNHDPLTSDSVYVRGRLDDFPGVYVIGGSGGNAVLFDSLDLEVWGCPHRDYRDMVPLTSPPPRRTRWQVAVAHGHFTPEPDYSAQFRASWLLGEEHVRQAGADYIALGHWDRTAEVSVDGIPAFYSGSPRLTRGLNIVQFQDQAAPCVSRQPLPTTTSAKDS